MLPRKSSEDFSDDASLLEDGQFTDDALEECLAFLEAEDAAERKATEQSHKQPTLGPPRKETTPKREGSNQLHTRCGPGACLQTKAVHVQDSREREIRLEANGESRKDLDVSEDQGNRSASKWRIVQKADSESRVESMREKVVAYTSNQSEGKRLHESDPAGPVSSGLVGRRKTSAPSLQSKQQSLPRPHTQREDSLPPTKHTTSAWTARTNVSNRAVRHSKNNRTSKKPAPSPGFIPDTSTRGRSILDKRILAHLARNKEREKLWECIARFTFRYRRSVNIMFGVLRAVWELSAPPLEEKMRFIRGFRSIFLLLSLEKASHKLKKSFSIALVEQLAGNCERIFGWYAPKIRRRIEEMAHAERIGEEAREKLCDALDVCCGKSPRR